MSGAMRWSEFKAIVDERLRAWGETDPEIGYIDVPLPYEELIVVVEEGHLRVTT